MLRALIITLRALRNPHIEEVDPNEVRDSANGGMGITGAGWRLMRDRRGAAVFIPGDLVAEAVTADLVDAAEHQEISDAHFGPFSPEEMRHVLWIARSEPDPDMAILTIAAHAPGFKED